jgi:antirestriction protein ArdC
MTNKNSNTHNGFNLYQHVTDQIIAALEKGVGPWTRPWDNSGAQFSMQRNASTNRPYHGINVLLLNLVSFENGYTDPRWVTFSDVQRLGGYIKKDEHHTKIIFWKFLEKDKKDELPDENAGHADRKVIPMLRYYRVFNVEQCSGLRLKPLVEEENKPVPGSSNEQADMVLQIPSIKFGGTRAFYNREHDFIQLPPQSAFETIDHYYTTGFHETVHWTGHESRLNRTFGKRFGDQDYAFEELVAEIGSAFLGGHIGLPFREMRHPEYIKHWIEVLKDDNKAIFTACRRAQDASEFILQSIQPTEALPTAVIEQPITA